MSSALILRKDEPETTPATPAEQPKLDVTIFEGRETSLDMTARIATVEYDLDLSRMVYIVVYLDANGIELFRREIDHYSLEGEALARKYSFY